MTDILLPGAVHPLPLVMLSFWEPWATSCLLSKPVENRTIAPARCKGPFVLVMHRSQTYDYTNDKRVRALEPRLPSIESLTAQPGIIVGALLVPEVIDIAEYVRRFGPSDWAFGPKCWLNKHHWAAVDGAPNPPRNGRQGLTYLDPGTTRRAEVLAALPAELLKVLEDGWDPDFTRKLLETP